MTIIAQAHSITDNIIGTVQNFLFSRIYNQENTYKL